MLRSALLRYQLRVIDYCCIATFLVRTQHILSNRKDNTSRDLDFDPDRLKEEDEAIALVRQCGKLGLLEQAKKLHSAILKSGIRSVKVFCKYLIRMYGDCGSVEDAQAVFDEIQQPGITSWTELIKAYAQNGHTEEAFFLLLRLLLEGSKLDPYVFQAVLAACESPEDLERGRFIRELMRESGYETQRITGTALLTMYRRCGSPDDGKVVFAKLSERDVAAWNCMIRICMKSGENHKALELFSEMQEQGVVPEALDYITILRACQTLAEVEAFHGEIISQKLERKRSVGAALVGAYGNCGDFALAQRLLLRNWPREPSCWSKLIAAYARHGYAKEALQVFHEMQHRRLWPLPNTFIPVLDACAALGGLVEGRLLHSRLVDVEKVEISGALAVSLINMYAQCGRLEEGWAVFADVANRNLKLWNVMIEAFCIHGQGGLALRLFQQMQQEGVSPDQNTFSSMQFVCCYLNLVEGGKAFFALMVRDYGLLPNLRNHIWMIQLLGREGCLSEAEEFISRTPPEQQSNTALWSSLLAACRNSGDIQRGKRVAIRLLTLDPTSSAAYLVLSRIYASEGRLDFVKKLQKLMKDKSAKQEGTRSWIVILAVVHEFTTGDESHPLASEIYYALEQLEREMATFDYEPDVTGLRMHDVADEEADDSNLWKHSEKLAVAFGLLDTPENETLQIFKNSRLCSDCHAAFGFISKLAQREILVRDTSRFHRFENGSCSCGNYW